MSERAASLEIPAIYSAQVNARKAVELKPDSPYAWLHLAYLQAVIEDRVTPEMLEALKQSIIYCRYCDIELSKWRLEFILARWQEMPVEMQNAARRETALLKANLLHHDYLRDILIRARLHGIDLGAETYMLELPGESEARN